MRRLLCFVGLYCTGAGGKNLSATSKVATFVSGSITMSLIGSAPRRPRILCLHGAYQTGKSFSQKIGGARRKLARKYDLDFLDGPIVVPLSSASASLSQNTEERADAGKGEESATGRCWWRRHPDTGEHAFVSEALQYVMESTAERQYDAILGFSQGGTLATALAATGLIGPLQGVKVVVTAGAPFVPEVFELAKQEALAISSLSDGQVPMLHLAGETDNLVAMESTRTLCEVGGGGKFVTHEQGHLFPTRAALVKIVMDFLEDNLSYE
mmetsp:Transcript_38674/g.89853  ORF Transcript_38674/g.89853 Transcript_38674/m.89853 type:complete len:269 (-) Transcript_38674:29-835(-)